MNKENLRRAAKAVLTRRFSNVRIGKAQGVIPGARLTFEDDGKVKEAAVRTSNEREVALLRDRHGEWRTLAKVQLVLVAVPSQTEDDLIDVLAFEPEVLRVQFDKAVKSSEKGRRSLSQSGAPVFLPLDPSNTAKAAPLREFSLWTENISVTEVDKTEDLSTDIEGAIRVIRSGIAKGLGVDVSQIDLNFSFKVVSK